MKVSELNVFSIKDAEVVPRLVRLVRAERKVMHLVLRYIHEVDSRRLFLQFGYSSIYKFLVEHLGYSEDCAYDRMQGARLVGKNPELHIKLEDGSLKLSQLVKVSVALNHERKRGKSVTNEVTSKIFDKIQNKTLFETCMVIASELDQAIQQTQIVKPQKDESVRIGLTLTSKQFEGLKEVQNRISHTVPGNDIAGVIEYLVSAFLKKSEGKRHPEKKPSKVPPTTLTQRFGQFRKSRRYLSVKVRRTLLKNAGYQCTYIHENTGRQCECKYQLQIDHRVPLGKGGHDGVENLRVLCGVHNRLEADRWGLPRPMIHDA